MNIIIENLTKTYGDATVLNNICLHIENSQSVGIIGESGSGKSTLLRMLSGLEKPNTGNVIIHGLSPITEKSEFQKKIGVVFQKHNLFPHLTIKENLMLILHNIKKVDKKTAEETVDRLLEQLRIHGEAHKRPSEVSGGQAQRASIARALSTNPELIFLDEPTAALDPILTDEVLNAVLGLKKDGRDFIFVTHEIEFLKQFADYVIFLKDGTIFEHGTKECLLAPKTEELAKFLKM